MPATDDLLHALQGAYTTWGYPIVFLGALLENTILLGLLLPGGALVMLGAVYAQQGSMAIPLVLLLAWLGMVAGTSVDYFLGRAGLRSLVAGTAVGNKLAPSLSTAERYLERYGAWALIVAHFVGHLRSFVAITAGMSTLPYRRFLVYEGIAALIWNGIFVTAGYTLGKHLDTMQRYMNGTAVVLAVALVAAYFVYRRICMRRDAGAGSS